jgi:hypothetical protein
VARSGRADIRRLAGTGSGGGSPSDAIFNPGEPVWLNWQALNIPQSLVDETAALTTDLVTLLGEFLRLIERAVVAAPALESATTGKELGDDVSHQVHVAVGGDRLWDVVQAFEGLATLITGSVGNRATLTATIERELGAGHEVPAVQWCSPEVAASLDL